jgi:hypothetical protein
MSSHRHGVTEMNFGLHAGARGDRNEFRSTYRRGATEMNFGLHTDAGRPQAFAEIYCGMSLHRHGATEMNFGLHAGARGDRNEFRSTCRRTG